MADTFQDSSTPNKWLNSADWKRSHSVWHSAAHFPKKGRDVSSDVPEP